jgi:hypothetical protein
MKNILIAFASSFLVFKSFASVLPSMPGNRSYEDQSLTNLTQVGNLKLTKVKLEGDLNVTGNSDFSQSEFFGNTILTGNFNLKNSTFKGPLFVTGNSEVLNSKFEEQTHFVGRVFIKNSPFQDNLKITSEKFSIEESTLKELEMDADSAKMTKCKLNSFLYRPSKEKEGRHEPSLILHDSSVLGDVTFEKDSGVVILKGRSKIEGKVINAKIVKE